MSQAQNNIVPYTFSTTQMGRNSESCSISTSASPDLLDSVNLHIFGKHSSPALSWYQSFFHMFRLSSSFGGPERELLGRCHPSPNFSFSDAKQLQINVDICFSWDMSLEESFAEDV
jgi:hypothetical protein